MTTNKNQHFVPRCYLKPFTLDGRGRAINLFNLDRAEFIYRASVRHQCAGDNFYGNEPKLESAIQMVERAYGEACTNLRRTPDTLSPFQNTALRRFWLLQYLRTEAALRRSAEMFAGLGDYIGSDRSELRMCIREAVHHAMRMYATSMEIVDDLRLCVVRNKTCVPFITSDNPAVLTNRWYLQDRRTRSRSFGLLAAGNLAFLPLSAGLLLIGYDDDVYSIRDNRGFLDLREARDVSALNQHQILNCDANIYADSDSRETLTTDAFAALVDRRPSIRHRFHYAVLDESDPTPGYSRYEVVEPSDAPAHENAIIHTEAVHAVPSQWPRFLRWRVNAKVYTNGTGVGFVRRYHAEADYWKEPARRG